MFILLIDNNRFYVSVLQAMLFKAGFDCLGYAENGLSCINQIDTDENPDVIIIDEGQCFLNGIDVIQKIRESKPETRIIILTGIESGINLNLLPENGPVYFMDKCSITAENLPQVLYNIFTEKISLTRIPPMNKLFSSLRRSFTGMLNF